MPKRDRQDIEIANYFLFAKKKPVLGICRGIQIINVACGGTLYQDLVKEGLKAIQEADIRAMRDGIESILKRRAALRISSKRVASWLTLIIIRESGFLEKDAKSRESRKTESQRQSR